ncbi:MAG: hypothetical protein Q8O85_19020 [Rhodoferax sp.]|uniref:hypothetical protein n=1 Tax=Rhodoferax sp. TaxID=50421 RepID=UPI0008B086A9|nr:hypothetical protein [Rhodoferax sp.]MDP2680792.1 hypothetical protein [Rhodoferax sp.]OGB72930.1 MAG: hypothetical protein A2496_13385 [Burkholderiales bacterium RIFOXYC12_FULL_60_6]
MSLRYLPEHAQATLLALDLAHKEAAHLRYSQTTLFALPINLAWVQDLSQQPELAEKVEAFVSRFGRLQDHLGDKLLTRLAALMGENSKTLLDTLAIAEKAGWLASADAFIAARKLRNALVHEYMLDAQNFLESLFAAQKACQMFFDTIETVQTLADQLALAG